MKTKSSNSFRFIANTFLLQVIIDPMKFIDFVIVIPILYGFGLSFFVTFVILIRFKKKERGKLLIHGIFFLLLFFKPSKYF